MLKQKVRLTLCVATLALWTNAFAIGQFQIQGDNVNGSGRDDWDLTVTDSGSPNDGVLLFRPNGDSTIMSVYQDPAGTASSTPGVGFDFLCNADGSSCASTSALIGASSGINQVNGNNGITASTAAGVTDLEIDLLDTDSGLVFGGASNNELQVKVDGTSIAITTNAIGVATGGVTFDKLSNSAYVTTGLNSAVDGDVLVTEAAVEEYFGANGVTSVGAGLSLVGGALTLDPGAIAATTLDSTADGDQYWVYESAIENYVQNYVLLNGDNLGNHTVDNQSLKVGANLIVTTAKIVHTDTGNDNDGSNDAGMILDASGNLVVDGSVTASSDRRLKKNVQPLVGALAKVKQLKGVKYHWINSQRGTAQQVGVIAQEVERIYPQLVKTGADGYKSVNYAALSVPLLEAVKELTARVEQLEGELAAFR